MRTRVFIYQTTALLFLLLLNGSVVSAQEQSAPVGDNRHAMELAQKSPMVQSAYRYLRARAAKIGDERLRKETRDAIGNARTCIRHRAGLSVEDKKRIAEILIASGLADAKDDATFPGGLERGIFPPVLDDGSYCPRLLQPFFSAPGGSFGSHHSYPGGLPIHEANNELAAINLASQYRKMYGQSNGGIVTMPTAMPELSGAARSDVFIDQDIILAAPIWHDWAKAIVFQWNADGSEFKELELGGNGLNDNNGAVGNSRTGSHHILGLAEIMRRGLRPALVITVASAHTAPTPANEYKVVNWLRTAAIIAKINPVQAGYLARDDSGRLRLPALRKLGSIDLGPTSSNLLPEYAIHNLSDADFTYSVPATAAAEAVLQQLAPKFGFNPADTANYNNLFRNRVLSLLTAERLFMIYSEKGIEGAKKEIRRLPKLP